MITFIDGDATKPVGSDPKVVFHIVNDQGKWGTGFAWPEVESRYRAWDSGDDANTQVPLEMGEVQIVPIRDDLWVINMCAQTLDYRNGRPSIRHEKLKECLRKVTQFCRLVEASAHAPKIGAGLAGGDWNIIKPLLEKCLYGIDTVIYE